MSFTLGSSYSEIGKTLKHKDDKTLKLQLVFEQKCNMNKIDVVHEGSY